MSLRTLAQARNGSQAGIGFAAEKGYPWNGSEIPRNLASGAIPERPIRATRVPRVNCLQKLEPV